MVNFLVVQRNSAKKTEQGDNLLCLMAKFCSVSQGKRSMLLEYE